MCRWTNNDWFPDNVCGQGGSAFVWTWSSIANKFISGLYKCNLSCEVFTKENLVFRTCCRSRLGNRGSRILLLLSWKHWTFDKCQALVYTNTLIFWPYVPRPWRQIHGRRTQGGPASLSLSQSRVKLQACEDEINESWDKWVLRFYEFRIWGQCGDSYQYDHTDMGGEETNHHSKLDLEKRI